MIKLSSFETLWTFKPCHFCKCTRSFQFDFAHLMVDILNVAVIIISQHGIELQIVQKAKLYMCNFDAHLMHVRIPMFFNLSGYAIKVSHNIEVSSRRQGCNNYYTNYPNQCMFTGESLHCTAEQPPVNTLHVKNPTFYIKHHRNGSNFYQIFS